MEFKLSTAHAICGDQLVAEIRDATGVDLGDGPESALSFRPPDTVCIPDGFVPDEATREAIQAVVTGHTPRAQEQPVTGQEMVEALWKHIVDGYDFEESGIAALRDRLAR